MPTSTLPPAVPFVSTLVGAFALDGADGGALTPRGSRARALLGYLMLARSGSVARERIVALLWSDRGEDQARASLRQVLFELRTLSGADGLVVVTRSDIRLVSAALTTDLDAFNRAARADDLASLARLFGDPPRRLLEGLDDISPAFDDWLTGQRERTSGARWRWRRASGRWLAVGHATPIGSRGSFPRTIRSTRRRRSWRWRRRTPMAMALRPDVFMRGWK